jgi:hypothetical protein
MTVANCSSAVDHTGQNRPGVRKRIELYLTAMSQMILAGFAGRCDRSNVWSIMYVSMEGQPTLSALGSRLGKLPDPGQRYIPPLLESQW